MSEDNPFTVSLITMDAGWFMRLILYVFLSVIMCGCAGSKVYVDSSEVDGMGAVVNFPSGRIIPIKLKKVISGNSIKLTNNESVRYIGVYIPDILSIQKPAKSLNEKLVLENDIRLEFDKTERSSKGELLAYVFTREATLVNAEIIRAGFAKAMVTPRNKKYKKQLLSAEEEAKAEGLGIWSKDFARADQQ